MARFIGQALAGRRVIPSMECALVCLLVAVSVAGNAMDIDRKVRTAATGLIAELYDDNDPASRSVALPTEVAVSVRVQAQATLRPK